MPLQEKEKDRTLELIKQQYLGAEKQKKRVMRPTEKFRFNFDWEAGDDTSRDLNPLTRETTEAALLFGRGMRAGVDRREQKKAAAAHEQQILRKMRESMVGLLNPCIMPIITACSPAVCTFSTQSSLPATSSTAYGQSLVAKSEVDHKCMLTSLL